MRELTGHQYRCLNSLTWSVNQLKGQVNQTQLKKVTKLIIQAMTGPWRYFHTPEHIFEVGETGDAVEVLAALFHDLVYVQVDNGISLNISRYIIPFIQDIGGQVAILPVSDLPPDRMFEIVSKVFGFVPGQNLSPFKGQNEFLSAIICAKTLEPLLSASVIAQIAACIEATIPFRENPADGLSCSDILFQRLQEMNQKFQFNWTDEEIVQIVKRSVRLGNRDVINFASSNSAHFLDNTWNLLPETNHDLLYVNSYTIRGYRNSLHKMEKFISSLKPEFVFHQFQGEPDEITFNKLVANTGKNLEIAKLYLGSKLTAIAILEALSSRIGLDIPISTMMGELPVDGMKMAVLEDFLPIIENPYHPNNNIEREVLELLERGRSRNLSYDLKNSPLATFLVKSIGFTKTQELLINSKELFITQIEAEEFLRACNAEVIAAITDGVARLFDSRKAALKGV